MVKDESPKKRAIYIYLPSETIANKFKQLSNDAKIPISKFLINHVENLILQEDDQKYQRRTIFYLYKE